MNERVGGGGEGVISGFMTSSLLVYRVPCVVPSASAVPTEVVSGMGNGRCIIIIIQLLSIGYFAV